MLIIWMPRYMCNTYRIMEKYNHNTMSHMHTIIKAMTSLILLHEKILQYVPVVRIAGARIAARAKAKAKSRVKPKVTVIAEDQGDQ